MVNTSDEMVEKLLASRKEIYIAPAPRAAAEKTAKPKTAKPKAKKTSGDARRSNFKNN